MTPVEDRRNELHSPMEGDRSSLMAGIVMEWFRFRGIIDERINQAEVARVIAETSQWGEWIVVDPDDPESRGDFIFQVRHGGRTAVLMPATVPPTAHPENRFPCLQLITGKPENGQQVMAITRTIVSRPSRIVGIKAVERPLRALILDIGQHDFGQLYARELVAITEKAQIIQTNYRSGRQLLKDLEWLARE